MTRFAGNVVRASAGLFGSSLLGLAIQVAIARVLGVGAFGLYGFGLGYVALWQVLMDGGSVVLATREAKRGDTGLIHALISLKLLMLAGAYVGLVVVARLAGFEPPVPVVVAILGLAAAASSMMTLGLAIFRGHEEFGTESLHLMAQRALFGALVAGVLVSGGGVVGVAAAGVVSSATVAAVAIVVLGRRHGVRMRFDTAALRLHGRTVACSVAPLLLADGLSQVQARSAQVILRFTSGMGEVGVYLAARRLIEGLHLLPSAFAIALFPRFVSAWRERPDHLPGQIRLGLRFTSTLAIAVLVGGLLWAEELTLTLFGGRYAASVPVLRVLAAGLAVMMLNAVLTLALVAVGRERAYATALAFAAAVNVAGNLVLTRWVGATGAAWATLASEGTLLVGCLEALARATTGFVPVREWVTLAAGGAVVFGALLALKQASVTGAAVLTVVVLVAGVETMSPLGLRDVLALRARGGEPLDRVEP